MFPGVFGEWEPGAAPLDQSVEPLSFGIGDVDLGEQAVTWRMDLPPSFEAAVSRLDSQDDTLKEAARAIEDTAAQVAILTAGERVQGERPVSFGIERLDQEPSGGELMEMLAESGFFDPGLSFGGAGEPAGKWPEAAGQAVQFFTELQKMVEHLVRVETRVGNQLVGKTMILPKGDLLSVWPVQPATETQALHLRSLEQALASRAALLRMGVTLVQGAGTLVVLAGNPAGALLAIPVLWKYFNRVLAQIDTLA